MKSSNNTGTRKSKSGGQKSQGNGENRHGVEFQFEQDSTGVIQAKNDLMQLGIELDDELIERLQKNLGIEKIFQVAHEAIHLIKNKPQVAAGSIPEVSYRYVTHDGQNNKDKTTTAEEVSSSLFVADPRQSVQMLKQLENRENELEPQYRPIIDQMIEMFRLHYGRSPKRFVSQLLGKNLLKEEKLHKSQVMPTGVATAPMNKGQSSPLSPSAQEQQMIHKWILQTRYIDLNEFLLMIQRVAPQFSPETVTIFFNLLAEDKKFASAKKRTVIDLFHFLNLLKSAVKEARRSFDGKTSRLATEIEFWKHNNAGLIIGGTTYTEQTTSPDRQSWIHDERAAKQEGQQRRSQSAGRRRFHHYPDTITASKLSVANLLGHNDRTHQNNELQGRCVLGRIEHELTNACDIPHALNSPVKIRPASPYLPRQVLQHESALPIPAPPPKCYLDSRKVAYLLGHDDIPPIVVPTTSSVNTLHREMINQTSVSYALGKEENTLYSDPNTPRSFAHRNSNWMMDDRRSSSAPRPGSAGNGHAAPRYRLKAKEQLYWNGTRPSVASALGNNNYS